MARPSDKPAKTGPAAGVVLNPLLEEARKIRAKKRFSQNFLVDEKVLRGIAEKLDLSREETVVEIGPGLGFLTGELLQRAGKVVAVELEWEMIRYLRNRYKEQIYRQAQENPDVESFLTLVEQDILKYDFAEIPAPKFKVVGNLPYQITSRILFHLVGELQDTSHPLRDRMEQLTIMVQKEVAERITAQPGQKAYNALSVALQFWYEARFEFLVPARSFYPAPKVESAVVSLVPRHAPAAEVTDLELFGKLVKGAFKQKRKTLRNSLLAASFAPPETLDAVFAATGIGASARAEALSLKEFGDLSNAFAAHARKD